MAKIEFIDAPGRRYDLFFLFTLRFNKERCMADLVNPSKVREDTEFMESLWNETSSAPEELLPLFRLNAQGKGLITGLRFDSGEGLLSEFEPETVFDGGEELSAAVLDFWLGLDAGADMKKISAAIRASGFDYRLKNALYSLLIDPDRALELLISELKDKSRLSPDRYALKTADELRSSFDLSSLETAEKGPGLRSRDRVYVSFCTYAKNLSRIIDIGGGAALALLGQDYADWQASLRQRTETPQLDVFGTAIAEKNRIDILNLILTRGEVSIKDVEQELKFSGTNAYYHLSLMIKANMIKTRNRGKAVYYSINRRFFDSVIRVLSKYGELSAFSSKGCDAGGPEWLRRMGPERDDL